MIAIACDHSGVNLKNELKKHLERIGEEVRDFGTDSVESCNYPEYAHTVTDAINSGKCERGILICGTGIGMSIAANKVRGIRCVVCSEPYSARLSRMHNNTNVLALGARVIGVELAKEIVTAWLGAKFEGGKHADRVAMFE